MSRRTDNTTGGNSKKSAKKDAKARRFADTSKVTAVVPSRFPTAHKAADPTLCATAIAEYLKWNKGVGEYEGIGENGEIKVVPCPLTPDAWSATLNDAIVLLNDYSEMSEKVKRSNVMVEDSRNALKASEEKLSLTVEQVMAAVTIIKALLTIINSVAKLLPETSKFRKAIESAKKFIEAFKS